MANRATVTDSDLEEISQIADPVLKKVEQRRSSVLKKNGEIEVENKKEGNVTEIGRYQQTLDSKINDYCKKKTRELGGDSVLEKKLHEEVYDLVVKDKIISSNDEISVLGEITNNTEVESKKILLEIDKEIITPNIEQVREERLKVFKKDLEEEVIKRNQNITKNELCDVREYVGLIGEMYTGGIEDQKGAVMDTNLPSGKLTNSWNEVQGIVGLFQKGLKRTQDLQRNYERLTIRLEHLNLPFDNFPKLSTFDRIMSSLSGNTGNAFSLVQNGGWLQRIDKMTGGWLKKTIIEASGGFVSKIGNQATKDFVKNSVGILAKDGFNSGLKSILSGMLSGGVKATVGATATTVGVAAGATNPVGWAILAGTALLKGIKKGLEKLGIDINKLKEGLSVTGNKLLDLLIGGLGFLVAIPGIIGVATAPITVPLIVVIVLIFGGQTALTESLVGSRVAPVEIPINENTSNGTLALKITDINAKIDISNLKTTLDKSEYTYVKDSNGNMDIDFSYINNLLPTKNTYKRTDLLNTAIAALGVPYWMTGGHQYTTPASGVDTRKTALWGEYKNPAGDYGRRYMGIDCSGFVRWVYYQATGKVIGSVASNIYENAIKITADQAIPGDIVYMHKDSGNHIGIYLGTGTDGRKYCIHSAGKGSGGGPQKLGGVVITTCAKGGLTDFARVKVVLSND